MIKKSRGEAQRLKFIPSLLLFIEIHGNSNVSSIFRICQRTHYVSVVKRTQIL